MTMETTIPVLELYKTVHPVCREETVIGGDGI